MVVELLGVAAGPEAEDTAGTRLPDYSLRVRGREKTAIVAREAATRLAILRLLTGNLTPLRGEVHVFGYPLHRMDRRADPEATGRLMGIITPRLPLVSSLTLAENLMIPLALSGARRSEARARVAAMLARVGLTERNGCYPGQCSPEECMRGAIGRAFIHRPPLIVSESPTETLDAAAAKAVLELLGILAEETRATVVHICEPGKEPDWTQETVDPELREAA